MLFKKNQEVYIEIRDDVIRYVELKSVNPLMVKKYGEKLIPHGLISGGRMIDPTNFKTFMAECVREWKLKRKKVFFVEPDETVAIKVVTVPDEISEEEMRGYLYQELGESIILPFEEPAIDYAILTTTKQESHLTDNYFESEAKPESNWVKKVLLVATPDDLVTSYSDSFRSNYLEPEAADISPLCYYRLYLDQIENDYLPNELMILQVDTFNATISIFENNVPIFMQFDKLFSGKKKWADDLDMAKEMQPRLNSLIGDVERILHFYQFSISNGNTIKEIILVGENPYLNQLKSDMESRLNTTIKTIPESIKGVDGKVVPKRFHLAIGLGLKGVEYYVSRY